MIVFKVLFCIIEHHLALRSAVMAKKGHKNLTGFEIVILRIAKTAGDVFGVFVLKKLISDHKDGSE